MNVIRRSSRRGQNNEPDNEESYLNVMNHGGKVRHSCVRKLTRTQKAHGMPRTSKIFKKDLDFMKSFQPININHNTVEYANFDLEFRLTIRIGMSLHRSKLAFSNFDLEF